MGMQRPWSLEEGTGYPGNGVTDVVSCHMGAGNQTLGLCKNGVLNHWVFSPTSVLLCSCCWSPVLLPCQSSYLESISPSFWRIVMLVVLEASFFLCLTPVPDTAEVLLLKHLLSHPMRSTPASLLPGWFWYRRSFDPYLMLFLKLHSQPQVTISIFLRGEYI